MFNYRKRFVNSKKMPCCLTVTIVKNKFTSSPAVRQAAQDPDAGLEDERCSSDAQRPAPRKGGRAQMNPVSRPLLVKEYHMATDKWHNCLMLLKLLKKRGNSNFELDLRFWGSPRAHQEATPQKYQLSGSILTLSPNNNTSLKSASDRLVS